MFRKKATEDVSDTPELEEEFLIREREFKAARIKQGVSLSLIFLFCLTVTANLLFPSRSPSKGVTVEYKHFLQQYAAMAILFEPVGNGSVDVIAIPYQYLKNFKLEKIVPQPSESYLYRGVMLYKFRQSLKQAVVVHLVPTSTGSVEGAWQLNDGIVQFSHFIYP